MQSTLLIPDSLNETAECAHEHLSEGFQHDPFVRTLEENIDATGIELPRPNHDIGHSARVAGYIPLVTVFLKKHGKHEYPFIDFVNQLYPQTIIYTQGAAFFSVVGRKDETGFSPNDKPNDKRVKEKQRIYRSYRQASADAFEIYLTVLDLFQKLRIKAIGNRWYLKWEIHHFTQVIWQGCSNRQISLPYPAGRHILPIYYCILPIAWIYSAVMI